MLPREAKFAWVWLGKVLTMQYEPSKEEKLRAKTCNVDAEIFSIIINAYTGPIGWGNSSPWLASTAGYKQFSEQLS